MTMDFYLNSGIHGKTNRDQCTGNTREGIKHRDIQRSSVFALSGFISM